MGVFDFLKKTQNDDDGADPVQASSAQTQDPIQTTTAPAANDVQASYGSFFSSSKPSTANVTYPLPSAGATLAPNYGAGVQPATTAPADDKDEKDELDITTNTFLPKSEPIPVGSDPLMSKEPAVEFQTEVKTQDSLTINPKTDSLDLTSNKALDFSAPIPAITDDISKQLEVPEVPVTTEALKAELEAPAVKTTTFTPAPEIKLEAPTEEKAEPGNDTETPNTKNVDDFNPPLDSLVINAGNSTQGDWNPKNAFMSASNEGISNEKVEQTVPTDLQPVTPAATPAPVEFVNPEADVPAAAPVETKTDESVDWLKDIEVSAPFENLETKTDETSTTAVPLVTEYKEPSKEEVNDIPEWMKEFESMQFDSSKQEKSDTKSEPAVDLVTELPVEVIPDKKKKNKSEEKEPSKLPVGDIKFDKDTGDKKDPVETIEPQTETLQLKYFRDVALVGLNTDSSDTTYSNLVSSLVTALKSSAARLIIDSSQGYGKTVLDALKDSGSLEVNGAYLRPYFSAYSDEPNGEVIDVKNYTETLFSNFVERLRYLYTSSELFIVLDSKGLVNLADITFLLAMQKMYYGKHKPVILFGSGWKNKLDTLNGMLTEDEKDKVYVVKDVNELAKVLKEIEEGYTKNNYYSTKRVTDLRDIEDEKQFMI